MIIIIGVGAFHKNDWYLPIILIVVTVVVIVIVVGSGDDVVNHGLLDGWLD